MLQLGEEKEKERVPTFSEFLQNRNSDFDSVTKVKTAERRDRFLPKKKKKQGADLVKVSDSSNVIYNFFYVWINSKIDHSPTPGKIPGILLL